MDLNIKTKIRFNGQEYSDPSEIMSVVENNGEVTLPSHNRAEPLTTKRQLQIVFAAVGLLTALGAIVLLAR